MVAQTAKAAVFVGVGKPLEIREFPVLPPGEGMARLSIVASGVCGTDVHIAEGRLAVPAPFIPGHEFLGRVEALGPGATRDGLGQAVTIGDTVIACVALPCGQCFCCRQGETASCLSFGVSYIADPAKPPHLLGGYAERLHQPARTLVRLPQGVPVDAAAALPCAGPTIIRAFDFAGGLRGDELVVVQGNGPVGLFAIAWAAGAGCTVIAIGSGSTPRRLEAARALGASHVLDYRATSPKDRLALVTDLARQLGRGNGADVVVEASGSPAAIPEGLSLLRTLGRYVVPGQYSSSGAVTLSPELITFKALKIIGSGQYKLADIATYLDFLRRHEPQARAMADLVTRFGVAQANEALAAVAQGRVVKAVLA